MPTIDELRAATDWQPAIIASYDHVKKLHPMAPSSIYTPEQMAKHSGQKILCRPNPDAHAFLRAKLDASGCTADMHYEIHPDDAARLWPEDYPYHRICACACWILSD